MIPSDQLQTFAAACARGPIEGTGYKIFHLFPNVTVSHAGETGVVGITRFTPLAADRTLRRNWLLRDPMARPATVSDEARDRILRINMAIADEDRVAAERLQQTIAQVIARPAGGADRLVRRDIRSTDERMILQLAAMRGLAARIARRLRAAISHMLCISGMGYCPCLCRCRQIAIRQDCTGIGRPGILQCLRYGLPRNSRDLSIVFRLASRAPLSFPLMVEPARQPAATE